MHSNEILKIVSSDEDSSEDTLVSYDEDTVLLIEDDDTTPLPIDEESEEKCLFEDDYEGTRLLIEDEVEVEEISYVAEDADEESTKLIDETEEAIIQKKDTEPKESNVDNCSTHNYLISESDSVTVSESNNTKLAEDEWKCPKCGKIHYNYVGTCGCGESKPANSSMYFAQNPTKKSKQTSLPTNKEWKCPKCGRINSYYVGTCGCGETRPANIDPFILSEIQYEQHLSPQYNHNERKDKQTRPTRPLQANEWRCPKCGKIHYYYVGTCGCGERRPSSI